MPTLSDKYSNLHTNYSYYLSNILYMHGPISPATVRDAAIDWRFPVHESLISGKVHPYLSTTAGSRPQVKGCFWIK